MKANSGVQGINSSPGSGASTAGPADAVSYADAAAAAKLGIEDGGGSSSVAVEMESADVAAERKRVAGLTGPQQQCIVMQDLRKVYPAQVKV